ncbi:MAG: ATP-binding protein [Acidobacteria bacterium]|nr:ATP-binding protein [Acidobacteriota bacterium]
MTLRTKVLLAVAGTIAAAAGLAGWLVSSSTQRAFERMDQQRTEALLVQFRNQLAARSADVAQRIDRAANSEVTRRILVDLGSAQANVSLDAETAQKLAAAQALDFLELVDNDGSIISSAQWPARSGYKNNWVRQPVDWQREEAFLQQVEQPDGFALGLIAVRTLQAGERQLWIIGGAKLSKEFLLALAVPAGMRVLLYLNLAPSLPKEAPISAFGPLASALPLEKLVEEVRRQNKETSRTIAWSDSWSGSNANAERVHALPLLGRERNLLAVLLIGNSQRALQYLVVNALDTMPNGGTLTLRTLRTEVGVQIEVSDTGGGLSQEERERLFTPGFATQQPDTDLGLVVVQSVVSDLDGRISVESAPGKGSTFRIELPKAGSGS